MSVTPERLRIARERKNLKQTQVRDRTGINNKTLSGYENGVSEPDLDTLKVLADLYEVSVDWLSGHTNVLTPSVTKDKPDELTTIMYHKWDQLDERRRKQALKLLEILEQEADEENRKE